MHRRTFTRLLGSGSLMLPLGAAADETRHIKVAVVTGADGAHLSAYFPALAETAEAAPVVLSDPSGESFAAAQKALGGKLTATYKNLDEMLAKEKPELALVTMEAVQAPPAIDAALDAGCHVLAEKPACVRAEDFEKLSAKAKQKDRLLVLALANRLNPEVRTARWLIESGKIGKIFGMEVHLIADQTRLTRPAYHNTWRAQTARGGGGHLIWLGIHWLDLAKYISGSRITDVSGFSGVVGGQPLDTEDSAAIAMRFDNGTFGTMTSGYYLDRGYHSNLKIWGSKGWLEIQRHNGSTRNFPLEWYSTEAANPQVHRVRRPDVVTGYTPFVQAIVRAGAGLAPAPLDSEDSLYVLKTIFACYKAAETGQRQSVA